MKCSDQDSSGYLIPFSLTATKTGHNAMSINQGIVGRGCIIVLVPENGYKPVKYIDAESFEDENSLIKQI